MFILILFLAHLLHVYTHYHCHNFNPNTFHGNHFHFPSIFLFSTLLPPMHICVPLHLPSHHHQHHLQVDHLHHPHTCRLEDHFHFLKSSNETAFSSCLPPLQCGISCFIVPCVIQTIIKLHHPQHFTYFIIPKTTFTFSSSAAVSAVAVLPNCLPALNAHLCLASPSAHHHDGQEDHPHPGDDSCHPVICTRSISQWADCNLIILPMIGFQMTGLHQQVWILISRVEWQGQLLSGLHILRILAKSRMKWRRQA